MSVAFVVDDHKDSADSLAIALEMEGYTVAKFYDFQSAYDAIRQSHPCIALIDVHVSGPMNAARFIELTKQHFPSLPIILISGDRSAESQAAGLRTFFLLKPYSLDEVLGQVKLACGK
jgi:DNA-binding NtrC family response regulator